MGGRRDRKYWRLWKHGEQPGLSRPCGALGCQDEVGPSDRGVGRLGYGKGRRRKSDNLGPFAQTTQVSSPATSDLISQYSSPREGSLLDSNAHSESASQDTFLDTLEFGILYYMLLF